VRTEAAHDVGRPAWWDAVTNAPWPPPPDPVPSTAHRGTGFSPGQARSATNARPPAASEWSTRDWWESSGRSSRLDPGAHTEGTSVTELLAAYGGAEDTGRRRRRRD
jgi:hypothetical protein